MTETQAIPVELSILDENRFGVRTARAMNLTAPLLPQVIEFCQTREVKFLIARCPADDLLTAQSMERDGFLIMDTLVYFRYALSGNFLPEHRDVAIHFVREEDTKLISQIAAQAFQGYDGHYHADSRLNRTICDELYVDWAARSCMKKEVADEVLVAELDHEIVGFLSIKMLENRVAEGRLFAVQPHAQGRGIGQALMIEGLYWSSSHDMKAMVISTQITNIVSQKSWMRVGFTPYESFYTFHKWFD